MQKEPISRPMQQRARDSSSSFSSYSIVYNAIELTILLYSTGSEHSVVVIAPGRGANYDYFSNGVIKDSTTNEVFTESAMTMNEALQACVDHWFETYYTSAQS